MRRVGASLAATREKERYVSARDFFERALKLDPQNAEAMVGLAYAATAAPAFTAGARRRGICQVQMVGAYECARDQSNLRRA